MLYSLGVIIYNSTFYIFVGLDFILLSFNKGWSIFTVLNRMFIVISVCLHGYLILILFSNVFFIIYLKILKFVYFESFFARGSLAGFRVSSIFVFSSIWVRMWNNLNFVNLLDALNVLHWECTYFRYLRWYRCVYRWWRRATGLYYEWYFKCPYWDFLHIKYLYLYLLRILDQLTSWLQWEMSLYRYFDDDRHPICLHIKQMTVSSVRNILKLVLLRLITRDGGSLS